MGPLFLNPEIYGSPIVQGPLPQSLPLFTRGVQLPAETMEVITAIERGAYTGDVNQALASIAVQIQNLNRAITSGTANLPVRENLEAEAKILVPMDTPMRNRIPRKTGAGLASLWRQITSFGGGYGAATTLTTGAGNNATANTVFTSAAGFRVGDTIAVGSGGTLETVAITAISGTAVTVSPALANDQRSSAVVKISGQPGGSAQGAVRSFFAETGAPADHTTVYAAKSAGYKLLGSFGSVTGFAIAAGANFQNQMATEKTNAIRNTMLNEENAIINGSSTDVNAPWGDGSNALGFDGILNLTTTANGVPSAQIQVAVGALTTAHLDQQITRLWNQGAQGIYMLMSGQEIASLAKIATGGSNNYRIMLNPQAASLGTAVTGYLHPITGELIPIIPSRFLSAGTIQFGADRLPDGTPALDIDVLPQVQLPELAPNDMVQGYVAQEVAPAATSPQVYPFIVSTFEVLRMKGSPVFAKSTGVTPA